LLAEVRRLASMDELTGLFNRRHFFVLAKEMFTHAVENKLDLCALIVDLDHFKHFNDQYGHAIGDIVLHETALLLKSALREHDILGRYGGEEFSLLLPNTNTKSALKVANRMIEKVTEAVIETEAGKLKVRLSIGVAGMSKETPDLHALINHADQAMYTAKESGGNRVVAK
jgi:diguanylate cyclase (GGDEF)-like protein